MFKSVFAATAALSMSAGAAFAGPYANIENNIGWVGGEYQGALTEFHVGYSEDVSEDLNLYVQGGPALVNVDGEGTETEFSAYVGGEYAATEKLDVYAEVGYLTGDEDTVTTEVGVTWNF